jgi:hypothetical protein
MRTIKNTRSVTTLRLPTEVWLAIRHVTNPDLLAGAAVHPPRREFAGMMAATTGGASPMITG